MKIDVYNQEGEKISEKELDPKVFGIELKSALIQQVVVAILANARNVIAHTKGRAEVRGGGKKPWKQKGTGRARHGSIRSPLWRGGGITFGPTKNRNFSQKINKKMKKGALKMVLSERVKDNKFLVLSDLEVPSAKTKQMVEIISKLPYIKEKKILIMADKDTSKVIRSSRNIPKVTVRSSKDLNLIDALNNEYIVSTEGSLDSLTKILL